MVSYVIEFGEWQLDEKAKKVVFETAMRTALPGLSPKILGK
jgi:hypothetical protein